MRDDAEPKRLLLVVDADAQSTRQDQTKTLSTFVHDLTFRYNHSMVSAANTVALWITFASGDARAAYESTFTLRNYVAAP